VHMHLGPKRIGRGTIVLAISYLIAIQIKLLEFVNKMTPTADQASLLYAIARLEPSLRVHYEEARIKAPMIVESESSLLTFLRAENMDDANAAMKLVTYWKYRMEIFGSRAFLPLLDLSGNGALDETDIQHLRMGGVVVLPNDDIGQKVLCLDYLRCQCTAESIPLRCWFYILATLYTQSLSDIDRKIVLILVEDSFEQLPYEKFFIVLKEAFPLNVVNIHCCYLQSEQVISENYVTYFATFLRQIFHDKEDCSVKVHVKSRNDNLHSQLKVYGLQKDNLPTTLGGSWLYISFRAGIDKETGKSIPHNPIAGRSEASTNSRIAKAKSDERRVRKRITDLIYARKRRQQDKQQEVRLKQQCSELRRKNAVLQHENIRLVQKVAQAKIEISIVESHQILACSNNRQTAITGIHYPFSIPRKITPQLNPVWCDQFTPTSTSTAASAQNLVTDLNRIGQLNENNLLKLFLMKENIEKQRLIERIAIESLALQNGGPNILSSNYSPPINSNTIIPMNHYGTAVSEQHRLSVLNQQLLDRPLNTINRQLNINLLELSGSLYEAALPTSTSGSFPPYLKAIQRTFLPTLGQKAPPLPTFSSSSSTNSMILQPHTKLTVSHGQILSDQLRQMTQCNETSPQDNNHHQQQLLPRVLL
jgi:hypothetical protein